MKIFLSFFIILCLSSCSDREKITQPKDSQNSYYTEINGSLSGILNTLNSPYLVTDTIKIEANHSLIIDPGVIVKFADSANFIINGTLSAIGSKDNFITFTSEVDLWKGITFEKSFNNSRFQFVIIENVLITDQDSSEFGAITIDSSSVTIQNCIIRNNEGDNGAAVASINSNIFISNCIFRENNGLVFGGGLLLYQSNSIIMNNTFYNNFCTNCGAAIALVSPLNEKIQNNIMYNNYSQTGCDQLYFIPQDSLNFFIDYNFVSMNSPNPQFFSEEDLRLRYNSPCLDAGDPDPLYNDVDGTRNDQGAFGGPYGDW